jgi:uncharacterized protein (TIGR03032 family)
MGMAISGNRLAIASKEEVLVLANASTLAASYPVQPQTYDGLFLPRAVYYCGEVDLHDMAWGRRGLYAVNTRFSCLSLINDEHSFEPIWQPHFISDLTPDDRCHLNGLAMVDHEPVYVTALGNSDTPKGWRHNVVSGGVVIHVPTRELVASGLAMPHSPRVYNGKLYVLLSATGELATIDLTNGRKEVVCRMPGFVRGMATIGDYLFIGLSKIRKSSSTFRNLPVSRHGMFSGVGVVHLPSGNIIRVHPLRKQCRGVI